MSEWKARVEQYLNAEYGDGGRVCVLATSDHAGRATARCMLLREIMDNGALLFVSDRRTNKDSDLRVRPDAEIAFWLPKAGVQIRIRGSVAVVGAEMDDFMRQRWWGRISDTSRALFVWPKPGTPRNDVNGDYPSRVSSDSPMPGTFELLIMNPVRVEILELSPMPHERTVWTATRDAWAVEQVSP